MMILAWLAGIVFICGGLLFWGFWAARIPIFGWVSHDPLVPNDDD